MRIIKLQLNNFQGIKELTLAMDGNDTSIYGRNATGKTTIANAITWLLTGKAYTGEKDYSPKTVEGADFQHQAEHSAEMVFTLENGETHSIKKVFKEIWTKKRGRSTAEMTGNTTDCYLNEIPATATDYQKFMNTFIGNAEMIQTLTRPDFFAEVMDWKARREILLGIVGDVSDQEVVKSCDILKELPSMRHVNGRTLSIADLKKLSETRRKEAKASLGGQNERIDENLKAIVDMPISLKEAEKQAADAEAAMIKYHASREKGVDNTDAINDLQAKRVKTIFERNEYVAKIRNEADSQRRVFLDEIGKLQKENNNRQAELNGVDMDIRKFDFQREQMSEQRKAILTEMKTIYDSVFDGETACPLCGAPYAPEKIHELKEKFNRQKSEKLAALNEKGQACSKYKIAEIDKKLCELTTEQEEMKEEIRDRYFRIQKLREKAEAIYIAVDTEDFDRQIKEIEQQIIELEAEERTQEEEDQELIRLQELARVAADDVSVLKRNEAAKQRIEELKKETDKLTAILEEAERAIYLCERFMQAKADMLTEKINEHFETVRFRLFRELMNGGLEDACDVLVHDGKGNFVPFSSANNAARINAGIEIIETIGRAWKRSLPIVIDNAESVNTVRHSDAQQIKLIVTNKDKSLRIETKEQEEK